VGAATEKEGLPLIIVTNHNNYK